MLDEDFVQNYLDSEAEFSKENAEKLLAQCEGILQLTNDLSLAKTNNRKLAVDTIVYFTGKTENVLKDVIDNCKNIRNGEDFTYRYLAEKFRETQDAGMVLTYLYIADTVLNEGKLFDGNGIEKLYNLQEEAVNALYETINLVLKDELADRSIGIIKVVNNLISEDRENQENYFGIKRAHENHIESKLNVLRFEENCKFDAGSVLEDDDLFYKLNKLLFTKSMSKEEIMRDVLMQMGTFEEQIDFIEKLHNERYVYPPTMYQPIRIANMKKIMEAITDISEYKLNQLITKTAPLTEEDGIKATVLYLSQSAEKDVTSQFERVRKCFNEAYYKEDTDNLSKAAAYYNFFNYSILGGCVYVICLILSTFREEKIFKRTTISSMNYKKHNRDLLIANAILAIILWAVYVVLSIVLIGDIMLSAHGILYAINSLIFTICALTIAFLIGNILNNKDAINGIIQVVGLGSSFLCGAFVPVEWLPDTILKIAHILPSYWFIQNNEKIKVLEEINLETIKPLIINMGVVLLFSLGFVIITNIISKKKRKIA